MSWHQRARRRRGAALWALVLLVAVAGARAENLFGVGGNLQVEGFISRGLDGHGRTEWELRGEQAQIRGQVTELTRFEVVFMDQRRGDFTLGSPRCRYLHSAGEVKSDAPVFVHGRGVAISGIGYDVYLDEKIVLIRSAVKMTIKQQQRRQRSLRDGLRRVQPSEQKAAATRKAPDSSGEKEQKAQP